MVCHDLPQPSNLSEEAKMVPGQLRSGRRNKVASDTLRAQSFWFVHVQASLGRDSRSQRLMGIPSSRKHRACSFQAAYSYFRQHPVVSSLLSSREAFVSIPIRLTLENNESPPVGGLPKEKHLMEIESTSRAWEARLD